jgi:8-oxo-dGTP diphosphatase
MKVKYVLVMAEVCIPGWSKVSIDSVKILVVEKNKPEWQKGKYNLLGGKVEEGETPLQAAVRELKEESGLDPGEFDMPFFAGKLEGDDYDIFCYKIGVEDDELKPQAGETEKVSWQYWDSLATDPKLIPNLKIVIPLMMMGVDGWVLTQTDTDYTVRFLAA